MRGRSSGKTGPPVPGLTRVGGGANIKGEGGPLEQSLELMGFTASDPFLFTIPLGARLGTWRSAPPLVLLYVASETQE